MHRPGSRHPGNSWIDTIAALPKSIRQPRVAKVYKCARETTFCFLLLSCPCPRGHKPRGTFSGTVTDESGAAVPNAKITAADTQKGTKPEAVSESSGAYAIPFLIPGIYDITAEALGIKTLTRQGC
jgi:hypothetical protein